MMSTLLSLVVSLAMVIYAAAHVNSSYGIFWDPVGILIVMGGTLGVASITFGPRQVFILVRTAFAVLKQKSDDAPEVAKEVVRLARDTRGEPAELRDKVAAIQFPFLRDGIGLIVDKADYQEIESILKDRIRVKQESDESTANMLRTLAKYPPSFGIIGTVLGLIALMLQLGTEGGAERMGPAMAVGLVATLYGLVLTNFILQPLSENLALKSIQDIRKRQIALLGVLLLKAQKRAPIVQEAVNSLLPVSKRIDELGLNARQSGSERAA